MKTVRLEIEFADELEHPVEVVAEIARRVRDSELASRLRSTTVAAVAVRGAVPERVFLDGAVD